MIFNQMLEWLKKLEPELDMAPIARQWVAAIPEELDFEHEAANMAQMASCLSATPTAGSAGAPEDEDAAWAVVEAVIPGVVSECASVPAVLVALLHFTRSDPVAPWFGVPPQRQRGRPVGLASGSAAHRSAHGCARLCVSPVCPVSLLCVGRYSSRRMLVQAFQEGAALSDVAAVDAQLEASAGQGDGAAAADGERKLALLRTIARWYGRGLFLDGLFHADPHPGNFLLSTQAARRPAPALPHAARRPCAMNERGSGRPRCALTLVLTHLARPQAKSPSGAPLPVLLDFGLVKRLPDEIKLGP